MEQAKQAEGDKTCRVAVLGNMQTMQQYDACRCCNVAQASDLLLKELNDQRYMVMKIGWCDCCDVVYNLPPFGTGLSII